MSTPSCEMSEKWVIWNIFHNCLQLNLLVIPLEYENTILFKHPHALFESLPDIISPVFRQTAIIFFEITIVTAPSVVRWVKQHKAESIIFKWHVAKVRNNVWVYFQRSAIGQGANLLAVVHEHNIRVRLVIPAFTCSTTSIKNWFHSPTLFFVLAICDFIPVIPRDFYFSDFLHTICF